MKTSSLLLTLSALSYFGLVTSDIEYTNYEELNAHLFDGDEDLNLSDQSKFISRRFYINLEFFVYLFFFK
jgi:hypothetical protein